MRKKGQRWSNDLLHKEALKYETRGAFRKGNWNAYKACHRREILNNVCSHMKCGRTYWSDEMIRDEALKYKTRSAFANESESAYRASLRRGILNEICSHMEGTPYVKWTDEMLRNEALKFNTRSEFAKENKCAYESACRRKIIDDVCEHMEPPPHQEKPHCVYLIEIFTTNNELYYYVGQTSALARRLNMHFQENSSDSPVFDFLNKTPIKYKKHYIVKDNLNYKESLALEKDTIKNLKDRGVRLLNK